MILLASWPRGFKPWQHITVACPVDRTAPRRRLGRLRVHARQLARGHGRLRRGRCLRGLGGRRGRWGREQATERLQCHAAMLVGSSAES